MQEHVKSDAPFATLMRRIADRRATVGVIGLGYVGLPLSRALAGTGHRVIGYDVDPVKAEKLNAGHSYIRHITDESIQAMRDKGFEATADVARLATADAILICVPTPLEPQSRAGSELRRDRRRRAWCRICAPASSWCWNRPPIPERPRRC